ncbi:RAD9, HUS1, RAD1-interacting nuclear orphan protein 1 [Bufo gargarizans]|uniref:RAD9, HUS1, RAD1-interacting nuclear orphan protein 1 n=1 Tax=Bufo gargarizans TaxID=30331 RepID=UPI001CF224DB|nr:RAD9, HUS1, RAD1-interacting nuclear orphan protein 1 [Bufo gargarizans]XP_044133936.1 RAD9, HUS1, RAD1-interacting nuclear orphan protein 1 [Bufo gargarizans]XP_044133937.1 RAD9, HUS1, RAD1-interacting nuclear orphan protein 1 [Bufo gargarizans]
MPPRKRTACNPRKPRLVFLENPQEGPVHEYGAVPPKAETKCVPTKPLDQSASTSWVSPQFDQTVELHFPARQRRRHVCSNSTVHSHRGDIDRSHLKVPGRKQSVCKFPTLSFSTNETLETQSFFPARRRPERKLTVPTPVPASVPSPEELSCSKIPSPPDIQTPLTSPKQNPLPLSISAQNQTPLSRRWVETCDGPDTPLANSPGQVLAEDTPEHEYGMRLTWRRRQRLMKYLKSRGRLKSSQVLVKP